MLNLNHHANRLYEDLSTDDVYDSLESEDDFVYGALTPNSLVKGLSSGKTKPARQLEKFISDTAKSSSPAYVVKGRRKNGEPILDPLPLARYFQRVMVFPWMDDHAHEFSEEIQLVRDCHDELGLCGKKISDPLNRPFPDELDGLYGYEYFNKLIEKLRVRLNDHNFKERRRIRKERSKRQFKKGCEYIDALRERYLRLLVLRIDFSYRDGVDSASNESTRSLQDVHDDFERFLYNRRSNRLFKYLVGYIRKLEYGTTKGYHFHTFLFFDGSKVHKDEYRAQQIGEKYWQESITKGAGLFHNCNRYKNRYRKLGIGMIHRDDQEKRENLLLALAYVTKSDQYLRTRASGFKLFTTGQVKPRLSAAGRPRRSADAVHEAQGNAF